MSWRGGDWVLRVPDVALLLGGCGDSGQGWDALSSRGRLCIKHRSSMNVGEG